MSYPTQASLVQLKSCVIVENINYCATKYLHLGKICIFTTPPIQTEWHIRPISTVNILYVFYCTIVIKLN